MRAASSSSSRRSSSAPVTTSPADAQVGGDGPRGGGVVPGDHLHADAGPATEGDGVGRLGPGRVDQADQRRDPQVAHQVEGVGGGVHLGLGERPRGQRDAPASPRRPSVRPRRPSRRVRRRSATGTVRGGRRARPSPPGGARPSDAVDGGHELVGRVEGHLGHPVGLGPHRGGVQPALGGEDQQRRLHRVAHGAPVGRGGCRCSAPGRPARRPARGPPAGRISPSLAVALAATPSGRPSGSQSSCTVISFRVRVPVLSEQMTEVAPRVSTEARRLTMAPRLAIWEVPMARVTVTTAGRPSGMAATARATDASTVSARDSPRSRLRMAKIATAAAATSASRRPRACSCTCSGVAPASARVEQAGDAPDLGAHARGGHQEPRPGPG